MANFPRQVDKNNVISNLPRYGGATLGGGDKENYKALWEPFLLSISLQCEGALRRTPTKRENPTNGKCVERPRNIEARFFLPQESFSQKRPPSHENNSHLQWYAVREISVWELHIWHPHEPTTYDLKHFMKHFYGSFSCHILPPI